MNFQQGGDREDAEQEGKEELNRRDIRVAQIEESMSAAAGALAAAQVSNQPQFAQLQLDSSLRPYTNNLPAHLGSLGMMRHAASMNAAALNQANANMFGSDLQAQENALATQEAYLREARMQLLGQHLLQQQQHSQSTLQNQGSMQSLTGLGRGTLQQSAARHPPLPMGGQSLNDSAFLATTMRLNPHLALQSMGFSGFGAAVAGPGGGGQLQANLFSGLNNSLQQQQHQNAGLSGLSTASLPTRLPQQNTSEAWGLLAQQQQQQHQSGGNPALLAQQQQQRQPQYGENPASVGSQQQVPQRTSRASSNSTTTNTNVTTGNNPGEAGQEEMKDEEYFELFGFNDEDAIQIINESFPQKLYRMLFEAEKRGQDEIVSWFPHGKAFMVKSPKRFVGRYSDSSTSVQHIVAWFTFMTNASHSRTSSFAGVSHLRSFFLVINGANRSHNVEEIMPKYFSTTRMASFQRQVRARTCASHATR